MEAAVRWSPHSTADRRRFLLVDVTDQSLTLNEVTPSIDKTEIEYHAVARYPKLPHFGAFAWSSIDESIVALGLVSGNASLVRLREDKEPSETIATYKIKQQRKCNSVAFGSNRWLAVALDKTRSDVCLNIYDTNGNSLQSQEPIRRLCAAELVSSVRFFPSSPQELVAYAQRSFLRLYDLRDGYFHAGGNLQVSTRAGNNITIDPLDENYFASAGSTDDPSVTVWDRRWIAQPATPGPNHGAVYHFAPAVDNSTKTSVWSLRYSGQKRGRLAICSSTGELRVIDMVEGPPSPLQLTDHIPTNSFGGTPWLANRYVSQTRQVERSYHDDRHGRDHNGRIVAFDWTSPEECTHDDQGLIALRPNRSVGILYVPATNMSARVTPRYDLSIGPRNLSLTEARSTTHVQSNGAPYNFINGNDTAEDFGPRDLGWGEEVNEEHGGQLQCLPGSSQLGSLLAPATIQRERCRAGYLFDCHKNSHIVAGNWQLERLWEIVDRFREQANDDKLVFGNLDLSFVGVSGLWLETIGSRDARQSSTTPVRVDEAIMGLNASLELPPFEGERTSFPEHRQLCLAVCGWKFTIDTLEEECQELIERGLYYQAIVQAVLHDKKHIALNLLRTLIRSKTIPNIGLNALLASDSINDEQREMCLWMTADTNDPALKALLTYLATGNWRDVMKTNYLHLGYRAALGCRYLNDSELSGFIQSETARAIKNGDLEGILLTGLGEQAMDLFQTYIAKTNDLQTAVLATAVTNPRYVDDLRWEMWKETYFMQIQSWRLFNQRVKFTVQHSQMARSRDGKSLLPKPPAQLALRCTHCQGPIERRNGQIIPEIAAVSSAPQNATRIAGPAANAGTVCQRCGRHMPRCGICLLWLGTPDPAKPSGARDLSRLADRLARFMSFCTSCGHGFHAHHAREWFGKHEVCPVPDCQCLCRVE